MSCPWKERHISLTLHFHKFYWLDSSLAVFTYELFYCPSQELENLKSQIDLANSRVQTNENIKEDIKKNYEEAISKMKEDYSEQMKQLHELYETDTGRRRGRVTSDSGVQTYVEEFPENVCRSSGSLTEFAVVNSKEPDIVVDSQELLTSSRLPSKADKVIVSEESAIYEPTLIASNQPEVPLQSGVDFLLQEKPKENLPNKDDDEPYKIMEKALAEVKVRVVFMYKR